MIPIKTFVFSIPFVILIVVNTGVGQQPSILGERRITPQDECADSFVGIRTQIDLGDKIHVFEVDTGCTIDTFDIQLERSVPFFLRWHNRQGTDGKIKTIPIHSGRLVGMGNSPIDLESIALIDLTPVSSARGYVVEGLIGSGVVAKYGLGYDSVGKYYYIGNSCVRVFESTHPLTVSKSTCLMYSTGLNIENHLIEDLLIDTGQNTELCLDSDYFNFFVDLGNISQLDVAQVMTIDGEIKRRMGFISSIELWGHELKNVPVLEGQNNKIGLRMLHRFDFHIDGQKSTISISRSADFHAPFVRDRSGLSLLLNDRKLIVSSIRENSPSSECGFLVGDIILAINGLPVETNWNSLSSLRKTFSNESPYSSRIKINRYDLEKQLYISW